MAEGVQLVLCSPLCFLVNKYSNSLAKVLKSAVLDFYSVELLSEAKQRLLKDVDVIKQQVGLDSLPHIPHRREGDSKPQREVDDIIDR